MSESVFQQIKGIDELKPYLGSLRTANGSPLDVLGRVTVDGTVADIFDDVEFLNARGLNVPVVLGLRFLRKHDCSITRNSFGEGRS